MLNIKASNFPVHQQKLQVWLNSNAAIVLYFDINKNLIFMPVYLVYPSGFCSWLHRIQDFLSSCLHHVCSGSTTGEMSHHNHLLIIY